jgi:hypothetical protein
VIEDPKCVLDLWFRVMYIILEDYFLIVVIFEILFVIFTARLKLKCNSRPWWPFLVKETNFDRYGTLLPKMLQIVQATLGLGKWVWRLGFKIN